MTTTYTNGFFATNREHARSSAEVIVPLAMELVAPRSLVDVGCGTGTWLAVFAEHGVRETLGIDGDYVEPHALEFAPERFLAHDLREPLDLTKRFDLVISLEVAEHLPEDCAPTYVESLTKLGAVVLFSAAIPGQGGTHHVNEQWPAYWATLFAEHGYRHVDCLRRVLWDDARVAPWYAQNLLFYVLAEELPRHPELARLHDPDRAAPLSLVHPTRYLEWVEWAEAAARGAFAP